MLQKGRRLTEEKIVEKNRFLIEKKLKFNQENEVDYSRPVELSKLELEDKINAENKLKEDGRYYNSAYNELIWYKLTRNKKMQRFMVDNYLTFDEY